MSNFKPHLCCDGNLDKVKFPAITMTKIDGVRMLNINGNSVGRSLKQFDNRALTKKYSKEEYSGFDGELIAGYDPKKKLLCNLTTSLVNTIEGGDESTWFVFDFLRGDVIHLPYETRWKLLNDYVAEKGLNSQNIYVVPYRIANDKEEVESNYQEWLKEGYEGLIGRSCIGKHKNGRATEKEASYFRLKPSSDKEAIVLELTEAMQNLNQAKVNELGHTERSSHKENKIGKGMVGSLICKDVATGNTITVGAGKMEHSDREHYWNNPSEIIGKFIKYESMDTGVKDKPRFPRFVSMRSETDMSE